MNDERSERKELEELARNIIIRVRNSELVAQHSDRERRTAIKKILDKHFKQKSTSYDS